MLDNTQIDALVVRIVNEIMEQRALFLRARDTQLGPLPPEWRASIDNFERNIRSAKVSQIKDLLCQHVRV